MTNYQTETSSRPIAPADLTLLRRVWSGLSQHSTNEIKSAYLIEIVNILNLAREEGRQEVYMATRRAE